MKQQLIGIGLVVLITGLCGCTEISHDFAYLNNEYGFGFDPPENWVSSENVSEEVAVGFSPVQRDKVWLNISTPSQHTKAIIMKWAESRW